MTHEITVRVPNNYVEASILMAEHLSDDWRDYADIKLETAADLMIRACDRLGIQVTEIEIGHMVQPMREDAIGLFARLAVPNDRDLVAAKLRFDQA